MLIEISTGMWPGMIEVGARIERWEGKAILELVEVRESSDEFIGEVCLRAALPKA